MIMKIVGKFERLVKKWFWGYEYDYSITPEGSSFIALSGDHTAMLRVTEKNLVKVLALSADAHAERGDYGAERRQINSVMLKRVASTSVDLERFRDLVELLYEIAKANGDTDVPIEVAFTAKKDYPLVLYINGVASVLLAPRVHNI